MNNQYQAMMMRADRMRADAPETNHILHLILTLVTLGIWAIVWLIIGAVNQHKAHYAKRAAKDLEYRALRLLEGDQARNCVV